MIVGSDRKRPGRWRKRLRGDLRSARDDYVYLVPFVEDEHTVFLKAIIPSRKATSPSSAARSVEGGKRERTRYSRYSKATFRKERRLNIRLLNKDLEAPEAGARGRTSVSTLISNLLHKYASGRLKEV